MSATTPPVFDPVQLNRTTHADTALQVEVLALFVAEAERLMQQVEDAHDPQVRGDRLRALIALARNTGAVRLAQEARELETQIAAEAPDFAHLREAVQETVAYVRRTGI
jgi:HPt (histidine-containing phosphotransfer) domain-containing protein